MRTEPQKQAGHGAFAGTVDAQQLTDEYWHERFKLAFKQYNNFAEMADELAMHDPDFEKAAGVLLLQRVQAGRAKLPMMAKAVLLMEKLRPAPTHVDLAAVLRRQGLVAPEN